MEDTVNWLEKNLSPSQINKNKLKEGQIWTNLNLFDPLGFVKETVSSIKLVKIFSSNTKPVLIKFNPDRDCTTLCIFKKGDDLRQD